MDKKAIISGFISVALFWLGLAIFSPVLAFKADRLSYGSAYLPAKSEASTFAMEYDPSRQTVCRSGCDYVSISAAISATNPLTPALFSILDTQLSDSQIYIGGAKTVTIVGLGMERTKISGLSSQMTQSDDAPIFIIDSGAEVTFKNLSIEGGKASTQGGALQISDTDTAVRLDYVKIANNQGSSGGGIALLDNAMLVINDSIIERNKAMNEGGGIFVNGGHLRLERSLIQLNSAIAGGGLFYASDQGASAIVNSTFTENTASLEESVVTANRGGGALHMANMVNGSQSSEIDFSFVTVSNNAASAGEAGGFMVNGGMLNLFASIVSENMADGSLKNCKLQLGTIASSGYNLASDSSCSLVIATDLVLADLQLNSLADNGGASQTIGLGQASHAIGVVPVSHCPPTDQRKISRTGDSACDSGAYEAENYVTHCSSPSASAGVIPDNNPSGLIDTVDINQSNKIYDLSILLQVENDNNFIDDFEVTLTSASSSETSVSMVSEPAILGGSCNPFGPSTLNLRFNDSFPDQLTGSVCFVEPRLNGDYRPIATSSASLNDFVGTDLVGRWDLTLADNAVGSTGELTKWCVQAKIKPDRLTVTRADDPIPNGCQVGDCSLREAILDANKYPGRDEITVDVLGPILLTQTGNGGNSTGDTHETGDLDIVDDLILTGNITDVVTIDASGLNDRLFDIGAGIEVHISGFELTGGTVSTGVRGGGAILNKGVFVGEHLLVRNNESLNSFGYGGAIQSTSGGDFTLRNSEVISNSAQFVFGGIYNWNSVMELTGVTIAGNKGSSSVVYNFASGGDAILHMNSVTLASNSVEADSGLGTFYSSANAHPEMAVTYLHNSVIGSHTEKGCKVGASSGNNSAMLVSLGYNLAEDGSCALTSTSDLSSTDPLLAPLAVGEGGSYSGRLVLIPKTLSPIHDSGDPSACPATDGRGASRPQHANCDIGAIELTTAEIPARIYLPIAVR